MGVLDGLDIETTDDKPPHGTEFACVVCGAPLTYSGRGKHPKYCDEHKRSGSASSGGGSRRGSTAQVNLAADTLMQVYNGVTIPLALVSGHAAETWDRQIDALDKRNRALLATNPDLVKRINSAAERGGSVAFLLSHVIAIAPVALVLLSETSLKRQARQAAQEAADTEYYAPTADPEAAFR